MNDMKNIGTGKGFPNKPSVDAQTLYARLSAMAVGEEISYQELSAAIGRNVQGIAYPALDTARRMCRNEHRMVFGTVRGKGLVRLDDAGIVSEGASGLSKIRREAKRRAKVLTCVQDFESMPQEKRTQHNAALAVLGAISEAAKPATLKRVAAASNANAAALPVGKVLDLMR
jgi:hypothetical protein